MKHTVIIIIAARMTSSRFPGKTLKKLHGKPMLEHIIDFLQFCKNVDKIVVATSDEKEDEQIQNLCRKKQCLCFKGSKNDVLGRYYECARKYNADFIVRLTADNPLVEPSLVDAGIDMCIKNNFDYVTNMIHHTFPMGAYPIEVMTMKLLKENYLFQKEPLTREHVTYHIRKNYKKYKVGEIFTPKKLQREQWRLTVDHIEDFNLIEKIFSKLYHPGKYIEYEELVNFLDKNNDLLKINSKYLPNQYLY